MSLCASSCSHERKLLSSVSSFIFDRLLGAALWHESKPLRFKLCVSTSPWLTETSENRELIHLNDAKRQWRSASSLGTDGPSAFSAVFTGATVCWILAASVSWDEILPKGPPPHYLTSVPICVPCFFWPLNTASWNCCGCFTRSPHFRSHYTQQRPWSSRSTTWGTEKQLYT